MKKSMQEIITFMNVAQVYMQTATQTKLRYAVDKLSKQLMTGPISDYQKKLEDLDIEYCSEDAAGNILTNAQGQFQFTKENIRKRNKSRADLLLQEVDIEPHYVTELPEDLQVAHKPAFEGFVIKPESLIAVPNS